MWHVYPYKYLKPADMFLMGSREPGDHVINDFSHSVNHYHVITDP